MIVADLDTIEHQMPQTPEFRKAIAFLRRTDLLELPDGKMEIDGSRVFAILQRYRTAPAEAPQFEYHRKYLDIQYVLAGEELIGVAPAGQMVPSRDYDPGQDICFGLMQPGAWSTVRLTAGRLAVLWPEDGHAPRLASGKPCLVRKIVVKIAVE
jgi:YhcH/YjgK/YiaL family protein